MSSSGPTRPDESGVLSPEYTLRLLARRLSKRVPRALDEPGQIPASVLVPFFVKDRELHLLFTRRTDSLAHHKGEISFPGGRRDPDDADARATALREAEEEMGIRPSDVRLIGRLDDTLTRTGFIVSSFVGLIPYPYAFKPSSLEIAEVLEAPVSGLMQPVNQREEVVWVDGRPIKLYSYAYGKHLIVGATARIVDLLFQALREAADMEGQGN